ncbi:MAG: HDOD domain-containing protein [Pseudomonadota bacterium]
MLPSDLTSKLEGVRDLPSPPKLAQELIELAEDPEVTLAAIGGVIEKDPALASKLLRVANSSLYSRGRARETVRQAILALGLNGTMTLALSFSLVSSIRDTQTTGINLKRYWRRSLMAANGARALAEAAGLTCYEQVFLASILQDIGVLVLDRAMPSLYDGAPDVLTDHAGLIVHEQGALNANHAQVGEWLLDRWRLAHPICHAVGTSHGAGAIDPEYEFAGLSRCVALSGDLADVWFLEEPHAAMSSLAIAAEQLLDIGTADLLDIFVELRDQLPETEAIFEMDILDPSEAERITAKAGELLSANSSAGERPALVWTANQMHERLAREFPVAKRERWPLSVATIFLGEGVDGAATAVAAKRAQAELPDTAALAVMDDARLLAMFSGVPAGEAERATRALFGPLTWGETAEPALDRNALRVGLATLGDERDYADAGNLVRAATAALHRAIRGPAGGVVQHAGDEDDVIALDAQNPTINDFMAARAH